MKTDAELAAEGWKRTESASRGVRWERGGRTWERDEVEVIRAMLKDARIGAMNAALALVAASIDTPEEAIDGYGGGDEYLDGVYNGKVEVQQFSMHLIRRLLHAERTK